MRNYFSIKVVSSRANIEHFKIGEEFWESVFEDEKYWYKCYITLFKGRKKAAYIELTLFDEISIMNDHWDIVDIADSIDGDVYHAVAILEVN